MTLLLATLLLACPPRGNRLVGEWTGTLVFAGGRSHDVHLSVADTRFGMVGRLTFEDLGRRYIVPVAPRDSVRLAVETARFGYLEITAVIEDDRMVGVVTGAARGSIALREIDAPCGALCEEAAGWYVSGADTLLLTFRPRGGMLMAISGPGGVALGERFPVAGQLVRLDRDGAITETIVLHRDGAGRVRALERRGDEARTTWSRIRNGGRQREMRFRSGTLDLTGTLFEPAGHRPVAAVAVVHGSLGGRIASRENFWQLSFAQALQRRGLAVLLPDKRGSGSSDGEWTIATVEELADDAHAALRVLRDLMPAGTRVGVAALSEGGWVAPVVASREGAADFVVSVSGSVLDGERNSAYEVEQLARQAGLSEEGVASLGELQALAAAWARSGEPDDWGRYLARREELLTRPELVAAVEPFPTEIGNPRVVQFVHRRAFDPTPYWATTRVPVFAAWGGADIRVPGSLSYERLGALLDSTGAGTPHELRLYEESGHAMEDPRTGQLRTEFLDGLLRWLDRWRRLDDD